jgi:predicted nucleic acid-binding protein
MSDYQLDACALVNLYCGWGGLKELRTFGKSWSIGNTALKEAMFVRDFDANGNIVKVTLDPVAVVANGNLQVLSLGDAREHASLIEFAVELDDGEAKALSLALHRKRVLVTDDRFAVRVASEPHVAVQTMGTPEILMTWANTNTECRRRLPEVVRRVSFLGPFQLKSSSPHYRWWQTLLTPP